VTIRNNTTRGSFMARPFDLRGRHADRGILRCDRVSRRSGTLLLLTGVLVLSACSSATEKVDTTQPSPATITVPQTETPDTLDLGSALTFTMPQDTRTARFTFEVPAGSVVTVDASADAQNTGPLELSFGPGGDGSQRIQLDPGQKSTPSRYVTSSDGGGSWAIDLISNAGDSVTLLVDAPLQADGGDSGDAGENASTARPVDPSGHHDGLLGNEDKEDWYTIPLGGGDIVAVTIDAPMTEGFGAGGVVVDLVYNGTSVAGVDVNAGAEESFVQIFAQDQTGEAYLRVSGSGPYGFALETGPQHDGGTDGDAGGDQADAKKASFGRIDGIIGDDDGEDFFVLRAPLDAVVSAELTFAPDAVGRARVEVVHNGNVLVATDLGPGQTERWTYALVNAPDEPVYLRVAGATGSYSATLTAESQPDGGSPGDAPGDGAGAKEVTPSGSFDGVLNNARQYDSRDWYQFTATETATIDIELAVAQTADAAIRLNVQDDALLATVDVEPGGVGAVTVDVVAGTSYRMQLGTGGQAAYTVSFG